MRSLESLLQFALACMLFFLVIAECAIAISEEWVTSIVGYLVCASAIGIVGATVYMTWREMEEEKG